jgi:transcriptional regulator GlxA family with amidase domain
MSADTHIAIVLYDGFDELDAVGPYEVFRSANAQGGAIDASLVTLVPSQSVTARHGLTVEPDDVLLGQPDVVLVPGGGWNDPGAPGARTEVQAGTIPDRLATLHENDVRVASVCTGALLVAEAGVLADRPATTHHTARDDLGDYGVDVREDRVVDDGDVVTAGGITSGIDLALHLVAEYCDADVAEAVAAELEWAQNS